MKILMVTPYLPSPNYSGGQTRSYNLLKHLSKDCQISLFCFTLPAQQQSNLTLLKKHCQKVVTIERGKTWQPKKILFTGFSPYPFLVANYFSPQMKQLIERELASGDYDLVHVECFYLMPNIPKTKLPVLLVDQTIEFAVYQHYLQTLPKFGQILRPLLGIDVIKLRFWEKYFWKKADCLVAVSQEDSQLMKKLSGRTAEVVLNGVDERLTEIKKVKKYSQPTVLYGVANFKWMQNKEGAVNLLKEVWPKIKSLVPGVKLLIAGRHSPSFIQSTGLIKDDRDVETKEVKNAEEAYRRSWVLVAPMKSGGGSRTKFFEAMACGLPIITTPEGIEGIEARDGREVLIGRGYQQLAEKTSQLLSNPKLATSISQSARALVKRKYTWKLSAQNLLTIYQKLAQQ
ncbi:MAG: glycosyltransferase family 4 protein [Patescibacteria group bacterium]